MKTPQLNGEGGETNLVVRYNQDQVVPRGPNVTSIDILLLILILQAKVKKYLELRFQIQL